MVELNEAFAAQALAVIRDLDLDPAKVNPNGGAIALGHPLGASGGRVLGTLAKVLQERGERYGVAAICIGVGQGLAVVLDPGVTDLADPRPLVLTEDKWAGRLASIDFPTPVSALARVRVPKNFNHRSPHARRDRRAASRVRDA